MSASTQILLLDIRGLQIKFAGSQQQIHAVKGIDLKIAPGEVVGLVGESGSGKSVTALSILRLLDQQAVWEAQKMTFTPKSGEQYELSKLSNKQMRSLRGKEISMIFQDPMSALNPIISCGEQVAETLRYHLKLSATAARKTALDWFARVRLPEPDRMYRSFPHQLSGGQQQRVMIAMAMCCHPSLLIADEPTTALDVTIQAAVLELMRELRESENTAILFISHDLGVVRNLADRVLVMHQGQIVEKNTTDKLFAQPQQTYTRGLLACRPPLKRQLYRLPTLEELDPPQAAPEPKKKKSIDTPLLEVAGLKLRYYSKRNWWGKPTEWVDAIDDVHFEVAPGKSLGVVGESGSGKTSLGRAIVGLVQPQEGSIRFKGEELLYQDDGFPPKVRPQIQMVFQNPYASLNPRLRVGEAIREPLSIHQPALSVAESRTIVEQLMQKVGLPADRYHSYPREFSGGQRQRLAIARALVLKPALLICDEAVSALDVSVQAQVLNLLKDLQEEINFSMIFISHDLGVVRFMCDRSLVMHEGRIVESGSTKSIIDAPQEDYTRQLVAAVLE